MNNEVPSIDLVSHRMAILIASSAARLGEGHNPFSIDFMRIDNIDSSEREELKMWLSVAIREWLIGVVAERVVDAVEKIKILSARDMQTRVLLKELLETLRSVKSGRKET